jgi:hypothetical protein
MRDLTLILEQAEQEGAYKPVGFNEDPDGYDDAIIGISNDYRLVYSIEKMILLCSEQGDLSLDDAAEWLGYNTFSTSIGDKTPIYAKTYFFNF